MSRYYTREYEKEDAEDVVELVEELAFLFRRALGLSQMSLFIESAIKRNQLLKK